jgi:hypothetical protein
MGAIQSILPQVIVRDSFNEIMQNNHRREQILGESRIFLWMFGNIDSFKKKRNELNSNHLSVHY